MIEILIPFLAFISVIAIGGSFLLAQKQKQMIVGVRLQDNRFVELPEKEKNKQKFNFLRLVAQIGNVVSHGNASRTLNEQLVRAGYMSSAAPAIYTGVKVLLFILGIVVMTIFVMPTQMPGSHKALLIIFIVITFN